MMTNESKLESLAKLLRRVEPSTAVRALRSDVEAAIASDRATDSDVAELLARAEHVLGGRTVAL